MVADTPLSGASPLPHGIEYIRQSGQRTVRPPSMMAAPVITARRWVSWFIQKLLKKHSANVGGAVRRLDLPPIAVVQIKQLWLTHRYRGQAPSHI